MKSPLRYPGGKSRQAAALVALLPAAPKFRSPFTGGGSVELAYAASHPDAEIWLNDADPNIAIFWQQLADPAEFERQFQAIAQTKQLLFDGFSPQEMGQSWRNCPITCLARTYILNRLSFSGNLHSGGFKSKPDRFTLRNLDHLRNVAAWLQSQRDRLIVTNRDWRHIPAPADAVLFLDPPYPSAANSKLYQGHVGFDLLPLARRLSRVSARWLLTIDGTPDNLNLFGLAGHCQSTSWVYGSTNVASARSRQGQELIVSSHLTPTFA